MREAAPHRRQAKANIPDLIHGFRFWRKTGPQIHSCVPLSALSELTPWSNGDPIRQLFFNFVANLVTSPCQNSCADVNEGIIRPWAALVDYGCPPPSPDMVIKWLILRLLIAADVPSRSLQVALF